MTQYLMGFDYGNKRIGVAVGQTITATARPLTTILIKAQQPDWTQIGALIHEWQPSRLVVGLPHHADGSDNSITSAVREFCQQLTMRYQLPVETIDETLSSIAAAEQLKKAKMNRRQEKKQKQKKSSSHNHISFSPLSSATSLAHHELDAVAAQIILETWFAQCL
jgi:putative Holliday junction resolvase